MNPTPPQGAGYRGGFSLQGVSSADSILKALHPLRLGSEGYYGRQNKFDLPR
ncbi:MAG: hypothetical protein HY454_01470 [Parcubacteria group bacterium]|nr:hypothetical protein [Parcubacteria group bacterium]